MFAVGQLITDFFFFYQDLNNSLSQELDGKVWVALKNSQVEFLC